MADDWSDWEDEIDQYDADNWDEDGHQRYKDDLAQGLINPDGTQRDPNPPDECEGAPGPRAEDGGTDDPWALPDGETYDTEAPF